MSLRVGGSTLPLLLAVGAVAQCRIPAAQLESSQTCSVQPVPDPVYEFQSEPVTQLQTRDLRCCCCCTPKPRRVVQQPPKIIRTAPIVVPCLQCLKNGNPTPLLKNTQYCSSQPVPAPAIQIQSKPVPVQTGDEGGCCCSVPCLQCGKNSNAALLGNTQACGCQPAPASAIQIQSKPVPQVQTADEGRCCCNVEREADSAGRPTVDPNLLAVPIAKYLSSVIGGFKGSAVTIQLGDESCNCSLPLSTNPSLQSPLSQCSATERKLAFGVPQCAVVASKDLRDIKEDCFYAAKKDVCSAPRSISCCKPDTTPCCSCTERSSNLGSCSIRPQSQPIFGGDSSKRPVLYSNPNFNYGSRGASTCRAPVPAPTRECCSVPCQ